MENSIVERYANKKVNYTVGLPLKTLDNLSVAAINSSKSKSDIFRYALEEYFERHGLLVPQQHPSASGE